MTAIAGPHGFTALGLLDAFLPSGRCRHCFIPRAQHPIHCWLLARPLGDKRRMTWSEAIQMEFNAKAAARKEGT